MTYEKVGVNTAETAELAKEIWYEHYMQFIPPDMVRGMVASHQSAEAIAEKISEGYEYFIIRDEENAAGYFAIKNTDTGLYLDKAYLKKHCRGKGHFSSLVNHLEKHCRENAIGRIYLAVNSDNENSIKAYKATGFSICGEQTNDFGDGAVFRDFIMEKIIQKK